MLKLGYKRIQLKYLRERKSSDNDFFRFRCNICGRLPLAPIQAIGSRETPSCYYCGSNLRFRSILAVLSMELFGTIIPISAMPRNKRIFGIGISDSRVYAAALRKKFSYTNTYYHRPPRLDITNLHPKREETADFVISSEVFEHVPPPVSKSFSNLYKLLKPGGFCVFTVPYVTGGATIEHFPELYRYKLKKRAGRKILVNRTREGIEQVFESLSFHGGKGSTLEMRVFSRNSLFSEIEKAGFGEIKVHRDSFPEFGIILDQLDSSFAVSMRKPGG